MSTTLTIEDKLDGLESVPEENFSVAKTGSSFFWVQPVGCFF
jgi:hypothetical protein